MSRSNIKRPEKYKPFLKKLITARPETVEQMEIKGQHLVKNFSAPHKLTDYVVDGHYTARAWSAYEVGERPPKSLLDAELLGQKGQRLLNRVFRLKNLK